MMRTLSHTRQRGQSIVELVLLLPILLMMILGMVDFSLAFTAHTKLRNAVAEGSYWAAQNPGDVQGVRDQIRAALPQLRPAVREEDIVITPCVPDGSDFETVISVSYNHPLFFGIFGGDSHVQLRNTTTIPQFGGCR